MENLKELLFSEHVDESESDSEKSEFKLEALELEELEAGIFAELRAKKDLKGITHKHTHHFFLAFNC